MTTHPFTPLSIPGGAHPLRPAPGTHALGPTHSGPDGGEPSFLGADELIADRLGLDQETQTGPAARSLVVWGEARGFRGIARDVARAAEMGWRTADAGHPPLCGPHDVLLLQADAVPEVLDLLERGPGATEPPVPAVVAGVPGGADPWEAAGRLAAVWTQPDVVVLPQGRSWLADHLARDGTRDSLHPRIGVVGASGGIGTSSLSLWIAARLVEDGQEPVVIDAVPGSVGLDACLSPEGSSGLRWHQLEDLPRRPEPAHLLTALPAPHGIPVLTEDPAHAGTEARPDVGRWATAEALSTVAVPVIDLGSTATMVPPAGLEAQWISRCSVLVLLVPFTMRGICQARAAVQRWAAVLPVVAVGVGPRVCDVSPGEAGAAIGCPLSTVLPHVPAAFTACDDGALLEIGHRRALRRPIAEITRAALEAASAQAAPVRTDPARPVPAGVLALAAGGSR